MRISIVVTIFAFMGACGGAAPAPRSDRGAGAPTAQHAEDAPTGGSTLLGPPRAGLAIATFAGGCFWCTESSFEHVRGVTEVLSGYSGGSERSPTYEQVSSGETGHAESIRVVYDPRVVSYEQLLDVFWRSHDPTTPDRSFFDAGHQYRSAIFVHSPEQRAAAEASKRAVEASHRFPAPLVTEILDAQPFWRAEDYHQDFYRTHAQHYREYREGSGRDAFITRIWGAGALERAQQHASTP